jgi:hypothetical protein
MNRATWVLAAVLAVVAYVFVRRVAGQPVNPFRTLAAGEADFTTFAGVDLGKGSKGTALTASSAQPLPGGAGDPLAATPSALIASQTLSNYQETAVIRSTWTPAELEAAHEREVQDALTYYQERATAAV